MAALQQTDLSISSWEHTETVLIKDRLLDDPVGSVDCPTQLGVVLSFVEVVFASLHLQTVHELGITFWVIKRRNPQTQILLSLQANEGVQLENIVN